MLRRVGMARHDVGRSNRRKVSVIGAANTEGSKCVGATAQSDQRRCGAAAIVFYLEKHSIRFLIFSMRFFLLS